MRKSYNFLLIALLAVIGFTSCKKDDDAQHSKSVTANGLEIIAGGKTYLVSKFKTSGQDYIELNYDSNGRLTRHNFFEDGKVYQNMNFSYNENTITITYVDDNESSAIMKLGANGYGQTATTKKSFKSPPYIYKKETSVKFTQNAEGYLTKIEEFIVETNDEPNASPRNYTATTDFVYSDGNLVRSVNKSEGLTFTEEFEYYTDKPNVPLLFDTYQIFLLGKPSKNLVKKLTHTDDHGGSQSYKHESTYTYTFNANGLPITATADDGTKVTIEYIAK